MEILDIEDSNLPIIYGNQFDVIWVSSEYTGIFKSTSYIAYYKDGKIHKEDGPAVIYKNGKKEYWLYNEKYDVNSVDELLIAYIL